MSASNHGVLQKDDNGYPVAGGVSSADATLVLNAKIDSVTGRLLVTNGGSGSSLSVTDGITTVTGVTLVDFTSGATVTGTTGTANVAISGGGTGTVTSVTAGTGLTATPSNPITTSGTITLDSKLSPLDTLGTPLQYVRVNAGATALEYATLPAGGTVTSVSVVSANGFTGTVATATTTPAITLTTSINTPILAGNGTALIAATTTGTGSTAVLSASPALTGSPTAPTQTTGDNTTKIATDAFVTTAIANAVAGVNPAVAVVVATTTAGDTSALTYNNGVSGVGATFTGSNNTALTIDGVTLTSLTQRVLVKNDTQSPSGAFNGVYTLTQLQTSILPPILTRALDYNMPSDINSTGAIPVVSGTVNANTSWLLTSTVNTIGTDPLTYVQFTLAPSTIVVGPASATDSVPALFNGTTGKLIKNSTPTGTGNPVMQTSPSLTTPTLGVALATSINGNIFTTGSSTYTGTAAATYTFPGASATIAGLASTQTFTNKRISRRTATTNAPGATPTTVSDNVDYQVFTGLATAITSMSTNLSGTPVAGDFLEFWLTDNGTARSITWGASFAATTVTLPTTTVISTKLHVLFEWGGSTWDCVAVA